MDVSFISYRKFLVGVFSLFLFLTAEAADRKVTISPVEGNLHLINGSAVNVDFDVVCHDALTGGTAFSKLGESLAPKRTANYKHEYGNACTSGSSSVKKNGMTECYNSGNFAASPGQCASGFHVCNVGELKARDEMATGSGWLNGADFSGVWNYGSYPSPVSSASGTGSYAPVYSSSPGAVCQIGGTFYFNCDGDNATFSRSTFCCSDTGPIASCEVTIKSSTPTGGFLQSPQFIGGRAF